MVYPVYLLVASAYTTVYMHVASSRKNVHVYVASAKLSYEGQAAFVLGHADNLPNASDLSRFGPGDFISGDYGDGIVVAGEYLTISTPSLTFIDAQHLLCITPPILIPFEVPASVFSGILFCPM